MAILIILLVICLLGLTYSIVNSIKEKKAAKASGMCSVCGKVQATNKLSNGKYACKECYKKKLSEELEQQRRAKEAERKRLAEEKPVHVKAIHGTCSGAYGSFTGGLSDYAGGWDVHLTVTNQTDKIIKYVFAELIPINTVGDVGYSPTVGAGAKTVKITGPLYPYSKLKDQIVKKFWYDIPIARIDVGTVDVVFMDGTEKKFRQ